MRTCGADVHDVAGERIALDGEVVRAHGYRLRPPPAHTPITVTAFGPAAVRVTARHADRVVISLATPTSVQRLVTALGAAAAELGRERPRTAAWVPVAVVPDGRDEAATAQISRMLAGYLAAPGYADMFTEAGFSPVVERARAGAHPHELLTAIPDELVAAVAAVGDRHSVRAALSRYADHVDDVVALVCCTDADPVDTETLSALAACHAASSRET